MQKCVNKCDMYLFLLLPLSLLLISHFHSTNNWICCFHSTSCTCFIFEEKWKFSTNLRFVTYLCFLWISDCLHCLVLFIYFFLFYWDDFLHCLVLFSFPFFFCISFLIFLFLLSTKLFPFHFCNLISKLFSF